jgi:hypothetical protein
MHELANFKFVGFSLFYVLLTSQSHKLMMQHFYYVECYLYRINCGNETV